MLYEYGYCMFVKGKKCYSGGESDNNNILDAVMYNGYAHILRPTSWSRENEHFSSENLA